MSKTVVEIREKVTERVSGGRIILDDRRRLYGKNAVIQYVKLTGGREIITYERRLKHTKDEKVLLN